MSEEEEGQEGLRETVWEECVTDVCVPDGVTWERTLECCVQTLSHRPGASFPGTLALSILPCPRPSE